MKVNLRILFLLAICLSFASISFSSDVLFKGDEKPLVFQSPVEVQEMKYYRDGGTIGLVIVDDSSKTFRLCLDGRLGSKKPYHVFIGSTHPSQSNAQLPIGGPREKVILNVLQDWLDRNVSQEQQDVLMNLNSAADLSEKEYKARAVIKIITVLKNR